MEKTPLNFFSREKKKDLVSVESLLQLPQLGVVPGDHLREGLVRTVARKQCFYDSKIENKTLITRRYIRIQSYVLNCCFGKLFHRFVTKKKEFEVILFLARKFYDENLTSVSSSTPGEQPGKGNGDAILILTNFIERARFTLGHTWLVRGKSEGWRLAIIYRDCPTSLNFRRCLISCSQS